MTQPPKPSLLPRLGWPLLLGFFIGIAMTLLGVHVGGWLLEHVLKNEVAGMLTCGSYFCVLSILGMQRMFTDSERLPSIPRFISLPWWMLSIAGAMLGIGTAALCQQSGVNAALFGFYALSFILIGCFVQWFEIEIEKVNSNSDCETKRNTLFLCVVSLIIGLGWLGYAWYKVCTCGSAA
jgi:hypothetical protein